MRLYTEAWAVGSKVKNDNGSGRLRRFASETNAAAELGRFNSNKAAMV